MGVRNLEIKIHVERIRYAIDVEFPVEHIIHDRTFRQQRRGCRDCGMTYRPAVDVGELNLEAFGVATDGNSEGTIAVGNFLLTPVAAAPTTTEQRVVVNKREGETFHA